MLSGLICSWEAKNATIFTGTWEQSTKTFKKPITETLQFLDNLWTEFSRHFPPGTLKYIKLDKEPDKR
jgi:hypothetical protein